MSWFNKRKVTVDTKKEYDKGKSWTLIDNVNCAVKRFFDSSDVVRYLYDNKVNAKEWIDETVQYEVAKELEKQKKEKFNKHFTFYVNKDIAPFVLNQLDALDCVGEWSIGKDEFLENYVEIDYDATRQVLFQTENGVAVKED